VAGTLRLVSSVDDCLLCDACVCVVVVVQLKLSCVIRLHMADDEKSCLLYSIYRHIGCVCCAVRGAVLARRCDATEPVAVACSLCFFSDGYILGETEAAGSIYSWRRLARTNAQMILM